MIVKRILIVESDRCAAAEIAELLGGLPAELYFAGSRSEAVELSLRARFSLCLISHGLSDGSGLPLLREVFGPAEKTQGLLLSRQPDLWVIQQALEAGYSAVLGKPPDTAQLAEVLRGLFGDASGCVESPPAPRISQPAGPADLPELSEIASLSNSDIRQRLSTEELIGIIRAVEYPFAGKERLEYFDRDTLERVVCLVRRWSQQRLERLRQERLERVQVDQEGRLAGVANGDFTMQGLAAAG